MAYIVHCEDCGKILYTRFNATNSIVSSRPHHKGRCLPCYAVTIDEATKKAQYQQATQLQPVVKEEKEK